jgi:sugar phosphate isomerase/epimerase
MIKIACQTIIFGNARIKDNLAEIARTVKRTGYDGMETGARHFYLDRLDYYQGILKDLDLKLVALHVGGDFLNKDSVKEQLNSAKNTIAFGRALGTEYLYLSGQYREGKTRDDYLTEAESYKEIGKMCNDKGIVLCYHNHNWEFLNNGEGMKILLDTIPAELMKLVPDVGWLEVAGVPAISFLRENISRVEALHFKDFVSKDVTGPGRFTELGKGIVPFAEIYRHATSLGRDWWISAEQDATTLEPDEAARINYEYIAKLRSV